MSKKKHYKMSDPGRAYEECVQMYRNKYFNLFRANFKWKGLDYRQEEYVMRQFYGKGTVAAFVIKGADELGFAPWAMQSWDMYDLPETVNLINVHGSPLIPSRTMTVDKDVCIGYIQRNKKPMSMIIDWYIDRIAQVEMVISTNLNLHKMPFLIPVDEDQAKVQDIVDKIMNNELCIFVEGADPALFKAVATGAEYIIDKLHEYKVGLENELKTYLGVDNAGAIEKREQLQLDEVNAGNDEINDNASNFLDCLEEWCDNIRETLGKELSVEPTSKPVEMAGEMHEGDKTGPKGGDDDE